MCSHAHPRPFHAHGEGGEFDVAEDTPRVQENIHAKFHENWLSIVAVVTMIAFVAGGGEVGSVLLCSV